MPWGNVGSCRGVTWAGPTRTHTVVAVHSGVSARVSRNRATCTSLQQPCSHCGPALKPCNFRTELPIKGCRRARPGRPLSRPPIVLTTADGHREARPRQLVCNDSVRRLRLPVSDGRWARPAVHAGTVLLFSGKEFWQSFD